MNCEAILFDADGTLFDYDRAERHALEASCRDAGLEGDPDVLRAAYREINHGIWEEFERKLITLEALRAERWRRFFARFGISSDPEAMSGRYLKHLAEGWFLMPGAEEIVDLLSGNYTLAVITNGIREVQVPRLAGSRIAGKIRHLVISEDAGVPKPDPGIFDYAFDLIGLSRERRDRVLIVGDSLSSDIAGGLGYGIRTCWFNPEGRVNDTEFVPDFEIRALSELPALLGSAGGDPGTPPGDHRTGISLS